MKEETKLEKEPPIRETIRETIRQGGFVDAFTGTFETQADCASKSHTCAGIHFLFESYQGPSQANFD